MKTTKRQAFTRILLVIAIIGLLNFIANTFSYRLDMTAERRYTLSLATKGLVSSLKQPVTVTLYFSKDLPPQFEYTKKETINLIKELDSRSKTHILYKIINPNESEETEKQAIQKGIQPQILSTQERDKMNAKRVFLGAEIIYGGSTDIIPVMPINENLEYLLASSLKKLSIVKKPVIGIIGGNGEAGPEQVPQLEQALGIIYEVKFVNLNATDIQPKDYKSLMLIDPHDSFTQSEFQKLDNYLAAGGNIFIGCPMINVDLQSAQVTAKNTNFGNWLIQKGILIKQNIIIDAQCGEVNIPQRMGGVDYSVPVKFPYFPYITHFGDNPATKGITSLGMPFTSEIIFKPAVNLKSTILASTSDKSNALDVPLVFNFSKPWQESDFSRQSIPVGIALSGPIVGSASSKLVIVSSGSFAVNVKQQPLPGDNLSFITNIMDWLSDESGLIDLRSKTIAFRPLEKVSDEAMLSYKWFNVLLPIILVIILGLMRNAFQKSRRKRWMVEAAR